MDASSSGTGRTPWGALPRLSDREHAFVPEQVAQTLRDEISAGRIPPGAKLPEVVLSEAMVVSRHTLRAGLQLLEEDGMARREPNRGVFVVSPSLADLEEIYRIRRIIEPGVVRTLAIDAHALDALESAARGADEPDTDASDAASLAAANQAFHRVLIEQAGSELLNRTMARVLAQMRLAFSGYDPSVYREFRERHLAIVELLRRGEAETAASVLDDYLRDSERRAVAALEVASADPSVELAEIGIKSQ